MPSRTISPALSSVTGSPYLGSRFINKDGQNSSSSSDITGYGSQKSSNKKHVRSNDINHLNMPVKSPKLSKLNPSLLATSSDTAFSDNEGVIFYF